MATLAQAAKFDRVNRKLESEIERDIRRVWSALEAFSPEGKRDALLDLLPSLVTKYGDVAAAVAAEYFEESTGLAAFVPDFDFNDGVESAVRYGIGHSFSGNDAQAMSLISANARRFMLQHGRSTMYDSAANHVGVFYARVPEAGACHWCRLLASRGAAYTSKKTASKVTEGKRVGEDFHNDCRCSVAAARDDSELPYDPEPLYDEYLSARNTDPADLVERGSMTDDQYRMKVAALTGNTDAAIAARMRAMYGGN